MIEIVLSRALNLMLSVSITEFGIKWERKIIKKNSSK